MKIVLSLLLWLTLVVPASLYAEDAEKPQEKMEGIPEIGQEAPRTTDSSPDSYELGTGDRIRLIVYGEPDLSGEFELDTEGDLGLPLIGSITAKGKTTREVEAAITAAFKEGYLINPKINIEVMNFRPFYILGEVKRPGSYPYVNKLTVLNAVALAGGYTYRAKTSSFVITRGRGEDKEEITGAEDTVILPGDSIEVQERFF